MEGDIDAGGLMRRILQRIYVQSGQRRPYFSLVRIPVCLIGMGPQDTSTRVGDSVVVRLDRVSRESQLVCCDPAPARSTQPPLGECKS